MFTLELYRNNARALLTHILSILNQDWLQYARSVRRVYEKMMMPLIWNIGRTCRTAAHSSSLSYKSLFFSFCAHLYRNVFDIKGNAAVFLKPLCVTYRKNKSCICTSLMMGTMKHAGKTCIVAVVMDGSERYPNMSRFLNSWVLLLQCISFSSHRANYLSGCVFIN